MRRESRNIPHRSSRILHGPDTITMNDSTPDYATTPHDETARKLAENLCEGFVAHDERDRDRALAAFIALDRGQFPHLGEIEIRRTAGAFVDALWEKDAIESPHIVGRELKDPDGLADADWDRVYTPLERRAEIVGMHPEYAVRTTESWKQHKLGGDYWTPILIAQNHEIGAAIGDLSSETAAFGRSGYSHLAARYLVGVELHDMHSDPHWGQALELMTAYFAEILRLRECQS